MFEAYTRHLSGSDIEQVRRLSHEAKAAFVYSAVRRVTRPIASWVAEGRRRRQSARELERLDDRMLLDIGVVRSDIPEIARRGVVTRPIEPDFGIRTDRNIASNPPVREETAGSAFRFPRADFRPVPRQRKAA